MVMSPDSHNLLNYLKALLLVCAATFAGELFHPYTSPPSLMIIFLLAVVLAALKLGLRAAVLTAVAGTMAFDFFFIPSRLTFTLLDEEHIPTFLGLLTVSLVISKLVSTARKRADDLMEREAETASLYRLSRDLAVAPDYQTLYNVVVRNAETSLAAQAAIFCINDQLTAPAAASIGMNFTDTELSTVNWSCKNGQRSILPDELDEEAGGLVCLPLVQGGNVMGVLVLRGSQPKGCSQRLVEGMIAQTAAALQRIELAHQAELAQNIQIRANFERALLNSISHDLRTPLVSIIGALSTVRHKMDQLSAVDRSILLDTASSEADRLNRFVGNLLDLTRINAGAILLNTELCDLQELIGCALTHLEQRIGARQINVVLPENLPLVSIDLVLMTQVLVNLLDNSLKYTPPERSIDISGYLENTWIVLEVADHGIGIPEDDLPKVFDRFYRIPVLERTGGTGLGLSICKGFVEAHGGRIEARNRHEGGLRVLIKLPMGDAGI